ncbi:hypothetical protein COY90_01675 [Candidatus Roizmanbacteria bacterium CG_4_10_14_0_8_um_filter_39_9]|uniref:DUF6311 domain-containing protein n=1 Tax=Candidatus Roizmanbacteria bacterium CG_4_10_14_0_8_um_filter_39_9 TaxID=1974829 RepID=A0A2M7QDD4_9BACT|nr:MAG: hypothetical protein COY90_01675 [Candidatus Roizmanbacteria bacterium CG_4_10_14_0_8_um_filter_39_9]
MRIKKIILFCIPILLILFYWKSTILHISTHLYSPLDVPFVIWILQNNIKHFSNVDFGLLYETNAMYPFPLSLSFTEHLFFPSFINWIISWFNSNPITQFNVLAILNHLLLYISFYFLAGRFTKNSSIKSILAFFVSFSPYTMSQTSHIQMIFFWPFLLSMYFLMHPKRNIYHAGIAGVLLGLQFLSSVYGGMMGFGTIALYYLCNIPKKKISEIGVEIGLFVGTFLIVSYPSISGYLAMQQMYRPVYEQSQYVTYSAHASDYFLVFINNSFINNSILRPLIGTFNGHTRGELAGFVGIVPLVVCSWYLVVGRKKDKIFIQNKSLFIWLGLLILIGFVCSIGPRLNWNGKYLVTPLPYWFVMKYVPFVGAMRAVARYYFLIIFAISVFMVYALDAIQRGIRSSLIRLAFLPVIGLLLFLEFYPTPLSATEYKWKTKSFDALSAICEKDPGPMLEYPFQYRAKNYDVGKELAYKTLNLFVSTQHNCEILSGFSAYEPVKYIEYMHFFQDHEFNWNQEILLNKLSFKYIKFNLGEMNDGERVQITKFVHSPSQYVRVLYEDKETIIVRLRKIMLIKPPAATPDLPIHVKVMD